MQVFNTYLTVSFYFLFMLRTFQMPIPIVSCCFFFEFTVFLFMFFIDLFLTFCFFILIFFTVYVFFAYVVSLPSPMSLIASFLSVDFFLFFFKHFFLTISFICRPIWPFCKKCMLLFHSFSLLAIFCFVSFCTFRSYFVSSSNM